MTTEPKSLISHHWMKKVESMTVESDRLNESQGLSSKLNEPHMKQVSWMNHNWKEQVKIESQLHQESWTSHNWIETSWINLKRNLW